MEEKFIWNVKKNQNFLPKLNDLDNIIYVKILFFRIKFYFVTFIRFLFSLLNSGNECLICGKKTYLIPICKECQNLNFKIDLTKSRCECCGKILISTKRTCLECRKKTVFENVDKIYPLFSYRLWNKEILFVWKINSVRALSYFFAKKVSEMLKKTGIEFIVPVPPRKRKIQKMGWDQIDELCTMLEMLFGFNVMRILERTSEVQQKKLDREERLSTIKSAYKILDENKIQKTLKKNGGGFPDEVCIIDDVCTTGSTLECCARILKEYGFKSVKAVCLFTVD